jgi:hypothetical protein
MWLQKPQIQSIRPHAEVPAANRPEGRPKITKNTSDEIRNAKHQRNKNLGPTTRGISRTGSHFIQSSSNGI